MRIKGKKSGRVRFHCTFSFGGKSSIHSHRSHYLPLLSHCVNKQLPQYICTVRNANKSRVPKSRNKWSLFFLLTCENQYLMNLPFLSPYLSSPVRNQGKYENVIYHYSHPRNMNLSSLPLFPPLVSLLPASFSGYT